jgi:hypothetical protein
MAALHTGFFATAGRVLPVPVDPGSEAAPPFPRNHARILYDNVLFQATPNFSVLPGALNTLTPNTFEKWSFTGPLTTVIYTISSNRDIDTICIGGHNLGSSGGATVRVYQSSGTTGAFTLIGTKVTASGDPDDPLMFHFDTTYSARRIQIDIDTGNGNAKEIGYISAGVALQMQRPFFSGYTPINYADSTEYYSNRTQSGNIVGRQIRRQGYKTSNSWKNIDDAWYRQYFAPFKESARVLPFFMAWNLLEYPNDVGFCRTDRDISAPYSGTLKLRTIDFTTFGV